MPNSTRRILIVENQRTLIGLLRRFCKELGIEEIVECRDGRLAWSELEKSYNEKHAFDLVFCGWLIPHIKAIDLLKMARADERFKDLPFLFITTEAEESKVQEALRWQVTQYILSPFTKDDIQNKLRQVVEKMSTN